MHTHRIYRIALSFVAVAAFAGPLAGVAQAAAPGNTGLPQLTPAGTQPQGTLLTLTPGTWDASATSTTNTWEQCDSSGANCVPITPAVTGNTYTIPVDPTNLGKKIVVSETATNIVDVPASQSTVLSNAVTVLPAPVNTVRPVISGILLQGDTLTASPGTWNNTPGPTTFVYEWDYCSGSPLTCTPTPTSTNSSSYVVTPADVNSHSQIEVKVTATNADGSTAATSDPFPSAPANVGAPKITGTPEVGQTLTEGAGSWTNDPTPPFAIQWFLCDSNNANCRPITGATTMTYTLAAGDAGATMQVSETATNAGGATTAYSAFTDAVTTGGEVSPPAVDPGSSPTISGLLHFGGTLTGSDAQFSGHPGSFSYQWLRCTFLGCQPIAGASSLTYTLVGADVATSIALSETASNSGGTSPPVVSLHTAPISAPSTTALQVSSPTPTAGQAVTLTASVSAPAGSIQPAGTVEFDANSSTIPGCAGIPVGATGPTEVCHTSFPVSTQYVTAVYSAAPGTFVNGSGSSPARLDVGRAATTVTVAASAHVTLGSKTTYTASVHPPAGSSLTPTGKVTFMDGGKTIKGCGSKALTTNRAPCTIKYLGLKPHRISARYSGDANFAGSASVTSHVVVRSQTARGFVAVFMGWSFGYHPQYTRIKSLSASGLAAGISVGLTCRGSGCPFTNRTMTVSATGKCRAAAKASCIASSSFDLTPIFHRAHLRVGTTLTVAITHPGWVGKYYHFTIRKGRKPAIAVSCLAVNGTRPGVGCRAS